VTTFEKFSYFSIGQVTHYNVTTFEKLSYFSHWAGNPLQCDQIESSLWNGKTESPPKTTVRSSSSSATAPPLKVEAFLH